MGVVASLEIDPDAILAEMRVETSRRHIVAQERALGWCGLFQSEGGERRAFVGHQRIAAARPVSIGSARTSFNRPPAKARFLTATCGAPRPTRHGSGTWPEEAAFDG